MLFYILTTPGCRSSVGYIQMKMEKKMHLQNMLRKLKAACPLSILIENGAPDICTAII